MKVEAYTASGEILTFPEIEEISFVNDGSYGPAENFAASGGQERDLLRGVFINFAKVTAVVVDED